MTGPIPMSDRPVVTVHFECRTCGARSPGFRWREGEPAGLDGVRECRKIKHLAVKHPDGITYTRHEFPILDAPSDGLFQPPDR